jgi:hypothetical protein
MYVELDYESQFLFSLEAVKQVLFSLPTFQLSLSFGLNFGKLRFSFNELYCIHHRNLVIACTKVFVYFFVRVPFLVTLKDP